MSGPVPLVDVHRVLEQGRDGVAMHGRVRRWWRRLSEHLAGLGTQSTDYRVDVCHNKARGDHVGRYWASVGPLILQVLLYRRGRIDKDLGRHPAESKLDPLAETLALNDVDVQVT